MRIGIVGTMIGLPFLAVQVGLAAEGTPKITFTKDVAPILYSRCVNCHHPNTTAPMSLIDYKMVRPWAAAIKEKVVTREMPPWSADPHYGKFQNDPHLTDQQIATIAAWVAAGAPEGDPKFLPAVPAAAGGWHIGTPDVILEMEEAFEVPADKELDMQYFILDPKLTKDTWVQAAEISEGNTKVVHHATVFIYDPTDLKARPRNAQLPGVVEMPNWQFKPPAPYKPTEIEARMNLAEVRTHEPFANIGHGEPSRGWPEGTAKLVKAGSKIVLQVHYHPTGKIEKDRSKVGLIFCKTPPENQMFELSVVNMNFTVPARDPNYEVKAEATFLEDVHFWSFQPHMHLRGKDMTYTLVHPNGTQEILLRVPKFDYGMQFWYELDKPLAVKKGSKMIVTAHFDNSAHNKANPNPDVDVKRGLQTTDEMMNGHLNMTVDSRAASRNGGKQPVSLSERTGAQ
ncbi:MAG: hypothetical protein JWO80_5058 [Bryobacterales bacterium]|nr:hypothetical protein [Bryobacterales bacterium]